MIRSGDRHVAYRAWTIILFGVVIVILVVCFPIAFSWINTIEDKVVRLENLAPICRKDCNPFGSTCSVDADCVPINGKTGVPIFALCTPQGQCSYPYAPNNMYAPPFILPLGSIADAFCHAAIADEVQDCFVANAIDAGVAAMTTPTGYAGACVAFSPCSSMPENAFASRSERSVETIPDFVNARILIQNKPM